MGHACARDSASDHYRIRCFLHFSDLLFGENISTLGIDFSGNDRKHDVRRVAGIVMNRLGRLPQLCVFTELVPGVGIAVVLREVAARDFQLNPVTAFEDVADRPQVDGVLVDLARFQ